MTNITLHVQGMTCAHCEHAVKHALMEVKGVNAVDIDLAKGLVIVTFEEDKATTDYLKEAIEEQGYDVI